MLNRSRNARYMAPAEIRITPSYQEIRARMLLPEPRVVVKRTLFLPFLMGCIVSSGAWIFSGPNTIYVDRFSSAVQAAPMIKGIVPSSTEDPAHPRMTEQKVLPAYVPPGAFDKPNDPDFEARMDAYERRLRELQSR